MLLVDTRQLHRYELVLMRLKSSALPYAIRQAVNDTAFQARRLGLENVNKKLITRNTYTARSIRVERALAGSTTARTGSTEGYMARQEFGGFTAKRGRVGLPIPTTYSSGEGLQASVRRRMPRKANMLNNIQVRGKRARGGRAQRNLVAVKTAARGGNVYLDMGRRKGLFRVLGSGKRRSVRMLWDLTSTRTITPKKPWLLPASRTAMTYQGVYYRKALIYQLERLQRVK